MNKTIQSIASRRGRPAKSKQVVDTQPHTEQMEKVNDSWMEDSQALYSDEFEDRVPGIYKDIRNEIKSKTRELAKNYIPKMYKALKDAGFSPAEARDKIESDVGNFWKQRTLLTYLPDEAKDITRATSGRRGGKSTAEHRQYQTEQIEEPTKEISETISPTEIGKEIQENIFALEVDLNKWLPDLLRSIDRAQKTGSMKISLEFGQDGELRRIEDVLPEQKVQVSAA